jgi:hypothetical protein
MKRRALIGLVAAVALTAAGAAYGAGQRPTVAHAAKANSQAFTDATGDSGNAPDVTNVTVSNDDNGQITFAITLANRTALGSQDVGIVLLDTNADGAPEFVFGFTSDGSTMFSVSGSTLTPIAPASFSGSFANGVQTLSVNKADIGNATQINLAIGTSGDGGTTVGDNAPDSGAWSYQVVIAPPVPTVASFTPAGGSVGTTVDVKGTHFTSATSVTFDGTQDTNFAVNSDTDITAHVPSGASTGPIAVTTPNGTAASTSSFTVVVPVKLAMTKPTLSKAVAGKAFTASALVTNNGTPVAGSIACSAKLGGKSLAGAKHTVSPSGKATCSWKLPKTAHGKTLTGAIGESYQGQSIKRPFSTKVK